MTAHQQQILRINQRDLLADPQAGGGVREITWYSGQLGRVAGTGCKVLPQGRGALAHVGQGALGRQ